MTMVPPVTRLTTAQAQQLELALFDHWLAKFTGFWLTPEQAAQALGWSRQTIYDLIDEGHFETQELPERETKRRQITRRSVVAFLGRTAQFDPREYPQLLKAGWKSLTKDDLLRVAADVQAELRGRPL